MMIVKASDHQESRLTWWRKTKRVCIYKYV